MSPFNVFRKDFTVKRPPNGSYNAGEYVQGSGVVFTVKASAQPATTEDMQSLPEARRQLGAYRLYSETKFQSLVEGVSNPDVIVIDGDDYEVAQVQPWKNGLIEHYKAIAVRVQPT